MWPDLAIYIWLHNHNMSLLCQGRFRFLLLFLNTHWEYYRSAAQQTSPASLQLSFHDHNHKNSSQKAEAITHANTNTRKPPSHSQRGYARHTSTFVSAQICTIKLTVDRQQSNARKETRRQQRTHSLIWGIKLVDLERGTHSSSRATADQQKIVALHSKATRSLHQ